MEKQDRRADPRADVELEISYRTAQEFNAAYTKNISGGGIFIKTQQPLPLNKEVQVRFTLPGVSHIFEATGLVVWTNPHPSRSSFPPGMGIKFANLDPESRKIIAGFVKQRLPIPGVDEKPAG